jgi:hypothetical protein
VGSAVAAVAAGMSLAEVNVVEATQLVTAGERAAG